MRNKFDRQLQILEEQLIHMGELCESAIANATKALSDGSIEQAKAVINADAEIDEMEKDIEKLCLKLLLQQQPVAKDLRRISAALKMIRYGANRRSDGRYCGNRNFSQYRGKRRYQGYWKNGICCK